MKVSWRIGRILGIDIYMHSTFLILLAWIAISRYLPTHSVLSALIGVLLILCLFGIVILHETGHALAARRLGIRTYDITLLPIGGVARLDRIPDDPKQEMLVALAGPAVNVALAGLLMAMLAAFWGTDVLTARSHTLSIGARILFQILRANVGLALFNLLPAFPMDGGRVLRALLAMRMGYAQATRGAAHIGQGIAIMFGLAGLYLLNPFLVLIALFVRVGAAQEARLVPAGMGHRPVHTRSGRSTDLSRRPCHGRFPEPSDKADGGPDAQALKPPDGSGPVIHSEQHGKDFPRKERKMKRLSTLAMLLPIIPILIATPHPARAASPPGDQKASITIACLRTAYKGETTAHTKYAAYAAKAEQEGYKDAARLFRGVAEAEQVHARNHKQALAHLGVPHPVAGAYTQETLTTRDNLKDAIKGETYESRIMYPKFIREARMEGQTEAARTFEYALSAEKQHAALYKEALKNLGSRPKGTVYYVNPTCGSTYANRPPAVCPVCGTPRQHFKRIE